MEIVAPQPVHWRPLLRKAGALVITGVGIYIGAEIAAGTHDVLNDLPVLGAIEIIQADEPTVFKPVVVYDLDIPRPASPNDMLPAR